MGCLVINTFLLRNPTMPIQGVIFGSPLFQMAEHLGVTPARMFLARTLAPSLEAFALQATV